MRMNAAETSASSAIADCTPLAVVSRSLITAEIDTFISDVSTTSTNIAMASRIIRRRLTGGSGGASPGGPPLLIPPPMPPRKALRFHRARDDQDQNRSPTVAGYGFG